MKVLRSIRMFAILPLVGAGMLLFAGCDSAKVEDAKEKAKGAAEGAKDAVGDAAKDATDAVDDAAGKATDAAGDAAKDAGAVVSAGFSAAAEKASEALKSVEGGGKMLTGLKEMFASAMDTLRGVTDKATAEAAVPKLDELNAKAEQMAESTAKLPEEAMSAVGKVVESGIEQLKTLADKLMENSEISEVIKPKVDALMDNLKKMTGAS